MGVRTDAQEQEVEKYVKMMIKSPSEALAGLCSFAAGTRHLIARWERLEAEAIGE